MAEKSEKGCSDASMAVHQYYMDIINCMPNSVYWMDLDCELKGCNHNFVKLLGLNDLHDFKGTPYHLLEKHAHWPKEWVDSLKLDDMSVIFSGKPRYNVQEPPLFLEHPDDKAEHGVINYFSTRIPLFDKKKEVIGLVVILTNVADYQYMLLPAAEVLSSDVNAMTSSNERSPRILMVEDNLIAQKVEQALMITLGCEVDTAESGEVAERLFEPGKYDIVLMDIGLQDTSGYIVAKKLREKEKGTSYHVPIIALTSYQADIVKYDCRDYFMNGVITKPLTAEQAQQILDHYVYHKNVDVSGLKSG